MSFVSVAMAVRNDEAHLAEAITSILDQTHEEFEFLILDDASTDRSPNIIRAFAEADPRIVPRRSEIHTGLTKGLNRLLERAKGELVARMDGNDISLPTRLEQQVAKLEAEELDLVWCNAVYIEEGGERICERHQVLLEETVASLPHPNHVVHSGTLYRRSSVLKLGGYDERYASGQDGDLWTRMRDAGCRFGVIAEPLLKLRIQQASVTGERLSYPANMNEVYARICLTNRDRERAMDYIKRVDSWRVGIMLWIRWLIGEEIVEWMKSLRPYVYDDVHLSSSDSQ